MKPTAAPSEAASPAPGTGGQEAGSHPAWDYDALILDAAHKQSLASARSLGRAGLRVAVGACASECDASLSALSFHSRYAVRAVVLPSLSSGPQAFANAVIDFVRQYPTRMILPTDDGSIASLMPYREQLKRLRCVLALAPDAALEIANDKDRTLAVARSLGIAYPKTAQISGMEDLPAIVSVFGFPIVLKPTISFSHQSSRRLQVVEVVNESEAASALQAYQAAGASVLAQQWASGRREGITMFVVDGDVRAACAHVAHRTSPALGGASVLRESVPITEDIYSSAVSLITAIGLQGVCEVEFRRGADNRPLLMEVNARLAGTIENAVHSGVDFPLMVWQWATGQPVERVKGYKTGVRTRWLHGDVRWLRDNYRRAGRPDSMPRARGLATFGAEFFRTHHLDCFDVHDLGPAWAELRTTASAVRESLRTQSR
jgi:predicted ATP-grasp superfamily ATP-dependent carboligase